MGVRPTGGSDHLLDRSLFGLRWRHLDLIHAGRPFLRRRGIEHDRLGAVLIHRIDGPDPGLDLHDHPWSFVTIVLRGGYTEEWAPTDLGVHLARWGSSRLGIVRGSRRTWGRFSIHRMPLDVAHRIVHAWPGTVTLVLRTRKVRTWGFYLPTGWVPWDEYDYEARRPVTVESNRPGETMGRES